MPATIHIELAAADVAEAIGEPARARMLYCLLDGHARTSTELAAIGDVSPSTASVHLAKMIRQRLVTVLSQGRHRYHRLASPSVARVLEALTVTVVAGGAGERFMPSTPVRLRGARRCYDHMAGHWAVRLRARFEELEWVVPGGPGDNGYVVTASGCKAFAAIGIDIEAARALRRRFAYACVDWSERTPHIGGALGQALLETALRLRWFSQDLDSRALRLTAAGRRQLQARFGLRITSESMAA